MQSIAKKNDNIVWKIKMQIILSLKVRTRGFFFIFKLKKTPKLESKLFVSFCFHVSVWRYFDFRNKLLFPIAHCCMMKIAWCLCLKRRLYWQFSTRDFFKFINKLWWLHGRQIF